MELQEVTLQAIDRTLLFLEKSPWNGLLRGRVESLKKQVTDPCVLAVAGRVKAGKSTLVNALLGGEFSPTGNTETTATINYFRYGVPDNPGRPVLCVWRNGRRTWESRSFLEGLQGNDETTLREAEGIHHLEFYLQHPDLQQVTLVDTPGTDAIVGADGESHEQTTDQFFRTEKKEKAGNEPSDPVRADMRKRQSQETVEITDTADAVIYLVGQVAHATNLEFLQEFQHAASGRTRALNAVGVMSKVDQHDEIMKQRHVLAAAVAEKLSGELNTVVPVSAALATAVRELSADKPRLEKLRGALLEIPESRFERMVASDRTFLREYEDCPVSVERRRACMEGMPWRVFVVIGRELRAGSTAEALNRLHEMSGFTVLRALLDNHFFKRGRLLRCYRILTDLDATLREIQRFRLHDHEQRIRKTRSDLVAFTDFIVQHPQGRSDVANRLRKFLSEQMPEDDVAALKAGADEVITCVEAARADVEVINRQFRGLQLLEDAPAGLFTEAERDELQVLFGLRAAAVRVDDQRVIAGRQIAWRQVGMQARDAIRKQVADLAVVFLGRELERVMKEGTKR